jgi:N-acyl-D-aspartate/D-glutamate deacylase
MSTHDLVIRNGTIVDGTGRAQFVGDVAVTGGVLTQVGGTVVGGTVGVVDVVDEVEVEEVEVEVVVPVGGE